MDGALQQEDTWTVAGRTFKAAQQLGQPARQKRISPSRSGSPPSGRTILITA